MTYIRRGFCFTSRSSTNVFQRDENLKKSLSKKGRGEGRIGNPSEPSEFKPPSNPPTRTVAREEAVKATFIAKHLLCCDERFRTLELLADLQTQTKDFHWKQWFCHEWAARTMESQISLYCFPRHSVPFDPPTSTCRQKPQTCVCRKLQVNHQESVIRYSSRTRGWSVCLP